MLPNSEVLIRPGAASTFGIREAFTNVRVSANASQCNGIITGRVATNKNQTVKKCVAQL